MSDPGSAMQRYEEIGPYERLESVKSERRIRGRESTGGWRVRAASKSPMKEDVEECVSNEQW